MIFFFGENDFRFVFSGQNFEKCCLDQKFENKVPKVAS